MIDGCASSCQPAKPIAISQLAVFGHDTQRLSARFARRTQRSRVAKNSMTAAIQPTNRPISSRLPAHALRHTGASSSTRGRPPARNSPGSQYGDANAENVFAPVSWSDRWPRNTNFHGYAALNRVLRTMKMPVSLNDGAPAARSAYRFR